MDYLDGRFWYEGPFLMCCNHHEPAPLPYAILPRTDEELWSEDTSQLELPPDGWTIFFACRDCGLVATRGHDRVVSKIVPKLTESVFRNDATLHVAEFPCAETRCKAPTKMHVDIRDGTVEDLLAELKGLKFHGVLPCGHPIKPIPLGRCRVSPVTARLW
jgi:hypothetical protein